MDVVAQALQQQQQQLHSSYPGDVAQTEQQPAAYAAAAGAQDDADGMPVEHVGKPGGRWWARLDAAGQALEHVTTWMPRWVVWTLGGAALLVTYTVLPIGRWVVALAPLQLAVLAVAPDLFLQTHAAFVSGIVFASFVTRCKFVVRLPGRPAAPGAPPKV